ncbi:MAG: hypothetical protein QOF65_1887 [Thermoleophilaceae bacterium]|jgi:hypothetical protein|nr:hypothetical protein [Thermoleophilaceae bacterium]MEA2437331.1 hypothetical protein [Thermoleophilaceae bacterium]
MGNTTVVVRKVTSDNEAERILDALDAAIALPSDRLSAGRRYTFRERKQVDRPSAVATLEAELDKISPTWPTHLRIHGID